MALLHYLWSRVAASNSNSDANVNWAEGQAPSSVNDSARNMMASAAGFRDDIAGAIVTGGTSTAYTVTSYQVFNSLANMNGQIIGFTPHATNGATVTLNVDGLSDRPLRSSPGVELLAGTLILGTPYTALYNAAAGVFYLQNFFVNPYQVPLGGMMDYIGSTAPNSAFVLPIGQAISRTTYATLFSLVSTTYGVGDGSTTFNVPDLTGRVTAMRETVADGSRNLKTAYFGDSSTLGAKGGADNQVLTVTQIPANIPVSVSGTVTVNSTVGNILASNGPADNWQSVAGATSFNNQFKTSISSTGSNSMTGTASGSGVGHTIVQATIIVNKILRVL